MAKTSVIIPSRDERFLEPTIRDIFRNRRGETEVVAVLDSDKWPEGWRELCAEFPDLHTIHNGSPKGMRAAINAGVASAKSRGAKYVMKTDGHCSFGEGFDEILKADCDKDWVVVPRRGRLDPENWVATDTHKPDIDYHYLSYPDDPNDFGGPGLNGKVWEARAKERADLLIDEEMSSQGSCWFMHTDYFYQLELMDESSYGPFWNEFQEIGLKCWLSGGRVMVNKKTRYLHLHKGRKYGRGYRLAESALTQGRNYTMKWLYNEAWAKQTLPFSSLIERFWPVPTWPENWEELVYGKGKDAHRWLQHKTDGVADKIVKVNEPQQGLQIRFAYYGCGPVYTKDAMEVTERVRELVKDNSLDIVVNNSTITPGQNPYRGKKKKLWVAYSYNGGEQQDVIREEKEWLIIGQAVMREGEKLLTYGKELVEREKKKLAQDDVCACGHSRKDHDTTDVMGPAGHCAHWGDGCICDEFELKVADAGYFAASDKPLAQPISVIVNRPTTAASLNDHLIRKFRIPDRRLRGPMPIELRDFHRDDLAVLFAELGFKRGAEIGVAEGKYSEVLLKANPECELLLVDPWHAYDGNAQQKTKEKHKFAHDETKRRIEGFPNAQMIVMLSMDAVGGIDDNSLDFVYLDANHSYPFIMEDLIAWSRKVRSGGIVALDDIYKLDEKRWGAGPMEAIYDYTRAMRINPWWLIAAHKSVDAFFVKP